MLKLTLDINCIIDLEKDNNYAPDLRKLIELHNDKKIVLRVPAISGAERKTDQTYSATLNEFRHRLNLVGLGNVQLLCTICREGLSFNGYALQGGGRTEKLEEEIQHVLFSKIEIEYGDFCKNRGYELDDRKAWRKWLNKKCDVLGLWSHIWFDGDIFITRDEDIRGKAKELIMLGAKSVLTPTETLALI